MQALKFVLKTMAGVDKAGAGLHYSKPIKTTALHNTLLQAPQESGGYGKDGLHMPLFMTGLMGPLCPTGHLPEPKL